VDRCNTLNVLADAVEVFYAQVTPNPELLAQHLADDARRRWPISVRYRQRGWEIPAINALIKAVPSMA
jgi:glutamyl-tRNA synthetase